MTEAEWFSCKHPDPLIEFVGYRRSYHLWKFRAFAVACCRRAWLGLPVQAKAVILTVERWMAGEAKEVEIGTIVGQNPHPAVHGAVFRTDIVGGVKRTARVTAPLVPQWPKIGEPAAQANLIRCVFGNPFRPVAFAPAWRSPTAVALAVAIYADRAFNRLPILADALEEAGCDDADILAHCWGDGPHVRGCWAVDLVLGKR